MQSTCSTSAMSSTVRTAWSMYPCSDLLKMGVCSNLWPNYLWGLGSTLLHDLVYGCRCLKFSL